MQIRYDTHDLSRPLTTSKTVSTPAPPRSIPHASSSVAKASARRNNEDLTYYAAYCHKASPTWFEWVKLTAHDIHTRLHIRDGYQHSWLTEHRYIRDAPQLMFYLNYPIQFVQVVGIVVSFDEYFDRFWLFTIDDSSGATIDVICRKPTDAKEAARSGQHDPSAHNQKSEDEKEEEKETKRLSDLVSSTVEIGIVLQVKGVITLFQRGGAHANHNELKSHATKTSTASLFQKEEPTRQISLQRLTKIQDTNQEISLISARTQFYTSVLSQPWHLSRQEQQNLHKEALGEIEHDKKRTKRTARKKQKLLEMEQAVAKRIQDEYEEEERARESDAEAARQAGVVLMERLQRDRGQPTQQTLPKAGRNVSNSDRGRDERGKSGYDRMKRKSHGHGQIDASSADQVKQADTTNDSFGPLEDEKSALLRLAFG